MTNHAHAEWHVRTLGDDLALLGSFDHLGSKREPVRYRITHHEARRLTFDLAQALGDVDPAADNDTAEHLARAMWLADGFTTAFWDKPNAWADRYRRRARIALDVLAHWEGNAND